MDLSRSEMLLGKEGIDRLAGARVAVFGIGGVGSYAVEALARSGIGALDLIDADDFAPSNLNRQLYATLRTVGTPKVLAAKERILEINPDCRVTTYQTFFGPETADEFCFEAYDYIIDAIDTVSGKLQLILMAKEAGVPIISSMGAGNKLDPTRFEVTDIYKTSVCPLAKVMRQELKKRGVKKLTVVYSTETPITPLTQVSTKDPDGALIQKRSTPGSISFVPSVVGLILAGEVIKALALRAPAE